jgi:general secretion pathway protein E
VPFFVRRFQPTAFGEKMVMQIFGPGVAPRLRSNWDFQRMISGKRWWDIKRHCFEVTGPTGSGRTTTLYTTLKL